MDEVSGDEKSKSRHAVGDFPHQYEAIHCQVSIVLVAQTKIQTRLDVWLVPFLFTVASGDSPPHRVDSYGIMVRSDNKNS